MEAVDHQQIEPIGQGKVHRLIGLLAKIGEYWSSQMRDVQPLLLSITASFDEFLYALFLGGDHNTLLVFM